MHWTTKKCIDVNRTTHTLFFVFFVVGLFFPISCLATDGHFLHGVGPVNEAMGGADTGLCLDSTGSIAWNPACTSRFLGKHFEFHAAYFIPARTISSTVTAGAFGNGMPQVTLSGSTDSHTGAALMPGMTFIYHPEQSRNAYHVGLLGVSGFGVDYDASTNFSNPILSPQPPNGFGFGKINSYYSLLDVPIGMSRLVTDKLSIGFSAVPALSMLKVIPAPFAAPVTAGSTSAYYLSANKKSSAWGIGGEAGVQYKASETVSLGAAYHTPIWFESFSWNSQDLAGASHKLRFRLNLPQYVTFGVGLTPEKRTKIGIDARWFNYESAEGFEDSDFNPDGSIAGFGWKNIWTVGGGIEQQIAAQTKVRAGYNFSQNPIRSSLAFINTPAPAIVQHHLSFGLAQTILKSWEGNITYYHAFQNSQTGPWLSPRGTIPGTSVTSKLSEDSISIGFSRSF